MNTIIHCTLLLPSCVARANMVLRMVLQGVGWGAKNITGLGTPNT